MGINDSIWDHVDIEPEGAWGIDHDHTCPHWGRGESHDWDTACGMAGDVVDCAAVFGVACTS